MAKIPKKLAPKKAKVKDEEEEKDLLEENDESLEDSSKEEAPERLKSSAQVEEEEVKDEEEEEDYLRKFQYKKVNNTPLWTYPNSEIATDPDKGSKAEKMKRFLLSETKVFTMIPLPEGSDPKVPYSVTLNGYRLDLPTNTYIDLPVSVAKIIRQSLNQTLVALSRDRIESNTKPGADNALGR